MSFADRIEALAAKAGLRVVKRNQDFVTCTFGLAGGRSQLVYLHPAGDLGGHPVVNIASAVAELPQTPLPGELATRLLIANQEFKIGAFGIVDQDGQRLLVFGHNMVLDQLEAEELKVVLAVLANTADQWEKVLSQEDRF